ncbi:hypothetical protein DQJ22_14890 [Salmonella enterica subsp. enterica]|nr:hypothetical protein [Salmonella enterica subsp. enterica serovar Orion]
MTAAQGVAQLTDNPDITKAIQTLLNIYIGGVPFSQFGTYTTDSGTPLPVNTLTYQHAPVALAGSFPTENGMEKHLQMLAEKKSPCLAVLTPPGQMAVKGLPFYFVGDHKYGEVDVSGEK